MTGEEWSVCTNPKTMLRCVLGGASDRKLRLFICACCRRIWRRFNRTCRQTIEISEQYADGRTSTAELADARLLIHRGFKRLGRKTADLGLYEPVKRVTEPTMATVCENACDWAAGVMSYDESRIAVRQWQAKALRDIFGNPFKPITMNSSWLSSTVVSLAQSIYDEQAFDRLPVLADALEDAGCVSADILAHCRQAGVHVRGCWVVDLVMGKK